MALGGPRGSDLARVVSLRSIKGRHDRAGVPFTPHLQLHSLPQPKRMCQESEEVFDHLLPTETFVFDFANASL